MASTAKPSSTRVGVIRMERANIVNSPLESGGGERRANDNLSPMPSDLPSTVPVPALVLTGGGARAAYQVGVLKAVAELLPGAPNPFPIIVGTSAGAVAAAVLATEAFRWHRAVDALCKVWSGFHVEQVFEAGALSMLR